VGHPWERDSREEEDKNIAQEVVRLGKNIDENAPGSAFLGISFRPVSGLAGATP
jgi:hypothetical protein